jgi:hypothetical protein
MKTPEQEAGIRRTLIQLGTIICIILALFFWKLNREAVVKPAALPTGFIKLETPRKLADFPGQAKWRVALLDRPDCSGEQCQSARPIIERVWASDIKLPRDQVEPLWFSPSPAESDVFTVQAVPSDFVGIDEAGWLIQGEWEQYSQSLLIVNPDNELVAWVRPPFNAQLIVRSLALAGLR